MRTDTYQQGGISQERARSGARGVIAIICVFGFLALVVAALLVGLKVTEREGSMMQAAPPNPAPSPTAAPSSAQP